MEAAARLLAEVVSAGDDGVAAARRIADRHRADGRPVPGFGHPLHRPDDPRTPRLFALAEEAGVPGRHIAAIRELGRAVDAAAGRHLTINATGAIAAVLSEIGPPAEILRGFAVISRAAGLVAHIREEQGTPAGRHIWAAADRAVPYTQARASRR